MNAVLFYVIATALVLAAAASLALPAPRAALIAAGAAMVCLVVFLLAAQLYLTALVLVLSLGGALVVLALLARRTVGLEILEGVRGWVGAWPLAAVACAAAGAGLVVLFALNSSRWISGSHTGYSLLTVIHYREPIAAAVGAIALGLAAVIAVVVVAVGHDERAVDASREARRRKQERQERRRIDREAARRSGGR